MAVTKWESEGETLAALIERAGMDRRAFAAKLGVSEDVLSNLVRGITRLRGERRAKAENILRVGDTGWDPEIHDLSPLLRSQLRPRRSESAGRAIHVARTGYILVPIFGSVPAGRPTAATSEAIEYIEMPEWGGDFERWGRIITGDSMVEEFQPGDIVVFESRRADNNMAVYAMKDGEDTFKILRATRLGKELAPMNSAPEHEAFSAEGWDIMGIAIERRRTNPYGSRDIRPYPHGYMHRFPHK
jgi:SOS-response transcriptional repressor LexA